MPPVRLAFAYVAPRKLIWGEPERAPHSRVCCKFFLSLSLSLYLSVVRRAVSGFLLLFCVCQTVVRRAVSHFRLLFCAFLLRHALFRKRLEPRVVFSEGTNLRTVTRMDRQCDRGTRMLDLRFLC